MRCENTKQSMRARDEAKERAVIDATIKVINEIGFVSASIAKIAKEAGVSVGTIYVYHKDKEDLMCNVYYDVKERLAGLYFKDLETAKSLKEKFKIIWHNIIASGTKMPECVSFAEQFANSPYYDGANHSIITKFLFPMFTLLESEQLKKMPLETFVAFFVVPAIFLGNRKLCANFEVNNQNIEQTFELAWGIIKK